MIDRIDHFVLTVRSIEASCEFYSRVLGMQVVTFGQGRRALQFGVHKINVHQAGREIEPKARHPTPGSGDFCLVTTQPLDQVIAHVRACGVGIEQGPVERIGALGTITSIYFRDPDGNLVEVARYG